MAHTPGGSGHRIGSKLGPRLTKLLVGGMDEHLRRTAQTRARLSAEGANEFFRGMSREKRQHLTPLLELYLGGDDTPAELEALLHFIAHGQGELSEVLGSLGVGQAVGTSILSALQNYLAPLNQKLIEADPFSLLDPGTTARALQSGWIDAGEGEAEAAKGGINGHRFNVLRRLAEQYPGVTEALELWRRGLISENMVREAFERNAISDEFIPGLLALKREHLSPADAALAVLRGHMSEGEGEAIAAVAGLSAGDFQQLLYNTGEPPGTQQMLEALRRGFISDAELQKGIRQSRVRDEWIPMLEKLRFSPASAADAVNAVVQGHLTEAAARQIAEWDGLRPQDFGWLVENAGNPIANMQALELFNRGVITQARVEEAIREGRTKDKYIPNVLALRVKLPPMFQTVKMVATGGITAARGAELLHHEGYEPDVVAGIVHAATSEQATKAKALAVTQVEELYEEQAFTEDEAIRHLAVLGISAANAKLILRVADMKRERKLINLAITPIKSQYVARHISEAEASMYLDKLRLPAGQRDLLLEIWAIERAANRKVLTEAQVIAANKLGLIDDSAAEQRLIDHGYSLEDARILIDSEKGRTRAAP